MAGSYALWAYGAPEPSHDVDLVVAESEVATAGATLKDAGFSVEHPPEDWLFKARTWRYGRRRATPPQRRSRGAGYLGLRRTA